MTNIIKIIKGFKKLYELTKYRNIELMGLLILIFFSTSIEVISISLVQPLTSIAAGEKIINFSEKNFLLNKFFLSLNIDTFDLNQLGILLIVSLSLSFFLQSFYFTQVSHSQFDLEKIGPKKSFQISSGLHILQLQKKEVGN